MSTTTRALSRVRGPLTVTLTFMLIVVMASAFTMATTSEASACPPDMGELVVIKDTLGGDGTFSFEADFGGFSVTTENGSGKTGLMTLEPGTYALSEVVPDGWALQGRAECCAEPLNRCCPAQCYDPADGGVVIEAFTKTTCTFTNAKLPTLTLEKEVENSAWGEATAGDFTPSVDGNDTTWGETLVFDQEGSHTIAESGLPGYGDNGWSCTGAEEFADDIVTLKWGDAAVCSIVNYDEEATLELVKVVVNDDGGTATASDWTLLADGPTPISGKGAAMGQVAPGTYVLSEDGPGGYAASGWVCNEGPLVGSELELGAGAEVTCVITNDDIRDPMADLAVDKTDFGYEVVLHEALPVDQIAYTITVDNFGPDEATAVVLTDMLPATTEFVSATPSAGTCSQAAGTITCQLGDMAVGAQETVDVVVSTESLGEVTVPMVENVAMVEGGARLPIALASLRSGSALGGRQLPIPDVPFDPDPSNNVATEETPITELFPPEIDLAIRKTDNGAKVVLNEANPTGQIAYDLTVTNLGPDDATGVVVTDTLPPTTTFVSATPSQGSCSEASGVVTCAIGGMAGEGGVASIDIVVATESLGDLTDPLVENVAVVDGNEEDTDPSNNEATEETPISEVYPLLLPQLSIDKVDTKDPIVLTEDDPTGEITYVVTVTNAPDAGPATGVVMTDTLPATVVFTTATPERGSCSIDGQVLTCLLGDFEPGDEVDITITVATEEFGSLTVAKVLNVAEVSANEADEPSDNRAEETTDISEVLDEEVLPETGIPSAALAVTGTTSILLGGLVLGLGRRLDRRS